MREVTVILERVKRLLSRTLNIKNKNRKWTPSGRPQKDRHKKSRITLRINSQLKKDFKKFKEKENLTYNEILEPLIYRLVHESKYKKMIQRIKKKVKI